MPTQPNARIILDSISPDDVRLTTMEVTLHRFVLAEFNTHRVFSRNSASSRAIPLAKQIDRVQNDPAIPVSFPAEQRGMQGGAELTDWDRDLARVQWFLARSYAVTQARFLAETGVHKSVAARLLEPFMWQTIIVSSTEWENFFTLRCSPMAQPEIRVAAEAMRDALAASTPTPLNYDEWHLPFVTGYDAADMPETRTALLCSAARCARVSYLTHDGQRDIAKDLQLAERLMHPGDGAFHASPFEHVARPYNEWIHRYEDCGNFSGWVQLRKLIEDDAF
jgi:thymidylate synthase ThyX